MSLADYLKAGFRSGNLGWGIGLFADAICNNIASIGVCKDLWGTDGVQIKILRGNKKRVKDLK